MPGFYEHGGIDPTGLLPALAETAQGGRQGASTITPQYVNNIIIESLATDGSADKVKLGAEKTIGDKLHEMKLAITLEKKYSKDQILAGHLNIVYFGNGSYGIQTAANEYFGAPAKDLTLPQAAALAGVMISPVFYHPLAHPDHVVARRNVAWTRCLGQDHITAAQHDQAVASALDLNVHQSGQGCAAAAAAPYFCDYIRRLILNDLSFGPDEGARENCWTRAG